MSRKPNSFTMNQCRGFERSMLRRWNSSRNNGLISQPIPIYNEAMLKNRASQL